MKIIIIGDGKVGYKLARQLSTEKYDVVLIDSDEKKLRFATDHLDIACVAGNADCHFRRKRRSGTGGRSFKAGRYRPCGSGYRMYFGGRVQYAQLSDRKEAWSKTYDRPCP